MTKPGSDGDSKKANDDDENDPAYMQFADMLCWSAEQVEPDPGQAEQQAKYIPWIPP